MISVKPNTMFPGSSDGFDIEGIRGTGLMAFSCQGLSTFFFFVSQPLHIPIVLWLTVMLNWVIL